VTSGRPSGDGRGRLFAVAGGAIFLASLVFGIWSYAIPYGVVDDARASDPGASAAINLLLFTAFALHHSLFARTGLKRRVSAIVPPHLERSAYVWVASVLFIGVCAAWRPVGGVIWQAGAPWWVGLVTLQWVGVILSVRASAQLDVLALAGIRQAYRQASSVGPGLIRRGLYNFVRHPIYFAWILMVWPTPTMTGTRLVFAAVSTIYLAIAIPFEERSLRQEFGSDYDRYAAQVRWKMVPLIY
jgi:methanethiol S-methyltransferase